MDTTKCQLSIYADKQSIDSAIYISKQRFREEYHDFYNRIKFVIKCKSNNIFGFIAYNSDCVALDMSFLDLTSHIRKEMTKYTINFLECLSFEDKVLHARVPHHMVDELKDKSYKVITRYPHNLKLVIKLKSRLAYIIFALQQTILVKDVIILICKFLRQ